MTDHACAWWRRFAGEVAGIELFESCVDVVDVEPDVGHDPLVRVELGEVEWLELESPSRRSRFGERVRVRARRWPRVAMTVKAILPARPGSAMARMFAMTVSRPFRKPRFTTRRRSSVKLSSAMVSASASQSRAAKYAKERSLARLAVFSSLRVGRLSSSKLARAASRSASSNSSNRLIRSPSTVKILILRHSASNPSGEVPCAVLVTTAPRLLSR